MADVQEAHGIKLFGATIVVQVGQAKYQEEPSKSDDQNQPTEKRPADKIIPCPRCKSMETKFCYFNNYNVSQPRHFCKGCQRYWTAGGALRNVPVGAGRRKNNKPPCPGFISGAFSPESCLAHGVQQFEFGHGMVEEWQLRAAHGSFHHGFPVKRRRTGAPVGQT